MPKRTIISKPKKKIIRKAVQTGKKKTILGYASGGKT
jgi:hypothetical protein